MSLAKRPGVPGILTGSDSQRKMAKPLNQCENKVNKLIEQEKK